MLALLLAGGLAEIIVGVDLGTEFVKAARSTVSGYELLSLPGTGVFTPAAVALKSSRALTFPLQAADLESVQVRYGADALPVLKRNPDSGYVFLPRAIGRAHGSTEFNGAAVANASALFGLFIQNYIRAIGADAFVLVVPSYWTPAQMSVCSRACRAFQLPLIALVDDMTALGLTYASQRSARLGRQPVHILFVDLGATTVKVFGIRFINRQSYVASNDTANFWSELTGVYFFAKAIAEKRSISVRRARKLLRQSEDPAVHSLYDRELSEIDGLIKRAMARATKVAGVIHEVQLIGGGSNILCVADRVRAAAGDVPVRRDLRAHEALAVGGLFAALSQREINPNIPIGFTKRPTCSVNLTCRQTHVYCLRGEFCRRAINETSSGCHQAFLDADPADVGAGVSPRLAAVELANLTEGEGPRPVGQFQLSSPEPLISGVRWCRGEECAPIEIRPIEAPEDELREGARLIGPILEKERAEAARRRAAREIAAAVREVAALLQPAEGAPEPAEEQRAVHARHTAAVEEGRLLSMEKAALDAALAELTALRRELRRARTPVRPGPAEEAKAGAGDKQKEPPDGAGEQGTEPQKAGEDQQQSEDSL
jgi:hypothetical protein